MEIKKIGFDEFEEMTRNKKEGLVPLGTGGELMDWVNGITDELTDEGIAEGTADDLFEAVFELTTTGGRTDLGMIFKKDAKIDIGKMALWRLRFGDCSWISDYLDNYASHHRE